MLTLSPAVDGRLRVAERDLIRWRRERRRLPAAAVFVLPTDVLALLHNRLLVSWSIRFLVHVYHFI